MWKAELELVVTAQEYPCSCQFTGCGTQHIHNNLRTTSHSFYALGSLDYSTSPVWQQGGRDTLNGEFDPGSG